MTRTKPMIESTRMQQIRGAKELLNDAVGAGVDATERVHLALARQPYALLARVAAIAAPVKLVERIQLTITGAVYGSVRAIHRVANGLATRALRIVRK